LTSLGGFTRRVRKITAENEDCQRYTAIILEDVARLEQMVRDIEEYVRFSKFYSFTFAEVDISRVIETAHKRAIEELPPAAVNAVTYTVKAEKGLPPVSADAAALEEAFYNLILNAYEAMPSGGKLGVAIKKINSAISVVISDTGVGMRKEELSEIFSPFVTSKTSGAGMGLSKVYLLVEEHQGSVSVSSELGKGTTFEVFLPLERLMTGLRLWEAAPKDGGSVRPRG
jgi:signal transduction histidine kinase